MAISVGDAVLKITGDTKGLDQSLQKTQEKTKLAMQKMQKSLMIVGAAFTAVGVAGLAMIQTTKKMNAQLGVTALNLGITTKEMRNLALEATNVTFPLSEVLDTFDLLARAGVEDTQILKDVATAFDTLGDATGQSASQVTQTMIPAMKTFGLTATEMAKKTDMMTFMARESTLSLDDFNTMVGYVTPAMVKQGLTIEELTASLMFMEKQGYAPGRVMTREFMKATTLATKENISLAEALGMTTGELEVYTEEFEGAVGMTQKYADVANEQYTIMDKIKQKFSEVTLSMSGFLEPLEPVLAGMTALGPIMLLVATNTKIATVATRLFGIAWKTALGPIGWAIAAVGLLTAAGIWMWKNWDKVQLFLKRMWANLKIVFGEAVKFLVNTVLQPFLLYIKVWVANIVRVVGLLVGIFNKEWGQAIQNVANGMQNLGTTLTTWADGLIEDGKRSKKALNEFGEVARDVFEGASDDAEKSRDNIESAFQELGDFDLKDAGEAMVGTLREGINNQLSNISSDMANFKEKWKVDVLGFLRSQVGVGLGKAEDLMKFQLAFWGGSQAKLDEFIRSTGKVWTGTGWLPQEQAERQGVRAQPLPHEEFQREQADRQETMERLAMMHVPFQQGGIVIRETLARIGERGPEAVIPLDKGTLERLGVGGGYKTANIYIMLNERVLAEVLEQRLVDDIYLRTGSRF